MGGNAETSLDTRSRRHDAGELLPAASLALPWVIFFIRMDAFFWETRPTIAFSIAPLIKLE